MFEGFLDQFRCGWQETVQGKWLQAGDWDMMSGLQSRCGITRAEPACVIDDSLPSGAKASDLPVVGATAQGALRPGLPRIVEQSERTSQLEEWEHQDRRAPPSQSEDFESSGAGAAAGDDGYSARSDVSKGSDMPHADREREKSRLQRLLKDFAKECVAGIAVNVVNTRTGRMPPYFFQMDRRLAMFSLRPSDGYNVESVSEDFSMLDVISIFKGHEVCQRVPFLGLDAASCVGIDISNDQRSLILHFDDAYERDKFYTSLQVLKMSVDIQQSR